MIRHAPSVTHTNHDAIYPERPVTLVVPWPAGGSTGVALRTLAVATSNLGQRIVIENRPGAAGTIGPTWMARNGKNDGYVVEQMPITVCQFVL